MLGESERVQYKPTTAQEGKVFEHLLDYEQFEQEFLRQQAPWGITGITVWFNWPRFLVERWPITTVPMQSQDDLRRCFLPWYPESKPLRLTDVPDRLSLLGNKQQDGIRKYVEQYQVASSEPIRFPVPTYALPDGYFLVMDCCHRLSALVIADPAFRIELCNVHGPMDPNCLMDLTHWIPVKSSN